MNREQEEYFTRLRSQDARVVVDRFLPGRVTSEEADELLCDCPHHSSASKKSLRVNRSNGLWRCWGCDIGGDLIHLVEFVQTGSVSKGGATAAFREAVNALATAVGMKQLHDVFGINSKAQLEADAEAAHTYQLMTDACRFWHSRLTQSHRRWLFEKYGLRQAIVDSMLVGYCEGVSLSVEHLSGLGYTREEMIASGMFRRDEETGGLRLALSRRIVFPYWERGSVVYAIGRAPADAPPTMPKYKKLRVHKPDRAELSPAVRDVLFNAEALRERPETVVVTEGITDAYAAMQAGFVVVSPVTTRIKARDLDPVAEQCWRDARVVLIQDNELSGIGLLGAIDTAERLGKRGVDCRIGILPPLEEAARARADLRELLGIERLDRIRSAKASEKAQTIANEAVAAGQDVEKVRALVNESKIDVADFLRQHDGDPAALRTIIDEATSPVEAMIANLSLRDEVDADGNKLSDADKAAIVGDDLFTALGLIADEIERGALAELLKERTGLGKHAILRRASRLAAAEKKRRKSAGKTDEDAQRTRHRAFSLLDDHTLDTFEKFTTAVLEAVRTDAGVDYNVAARGCWEWLKRSGAQAIRPGGTCGFLSIGGDALALDGFDFRAWFTRATKLVVSSGPGYLLVRALRDVISGDAYDGSTLWYATDDGSVLIPSRNAAGDIVEIGPARVSIRPPTTVARGLAITSMFAPFTLIDDPGNPDEILNRYVGRHLACSSAERQLIIDWLCTVPIMAHAGMTPGVRFEGPPGSGKTFASKLISVGFYGQQTHAMMTPAARAWLAPMTPILILDNIEHGDCDKALTDFVLCAATWSTRVIREEQSTRSQVFRTSILTTGIEPLRSVDELMQRVFVFNFDEKYHAAGLLNEPDVLGELHSNRDLVVSAILRRAAEVVGLIKDGAAPGIRRALREQLGIHSKRRCDAFIALMYLARVASCPPEERDELLTVIHPAYEFVLQAEHERTQEQLREDSEIGFAMHALFDRLRGTTAPGRDRQTFGLDVSGLGKDTRVDGADARKLLAAFLAVAKDGGWRFGITSPRSLGRRLRQQLDRLRDDGFTIRSKMRDNRFVYSIGIRSGESLSVADAERFGGAGATDQTSGGARPAGRPTGGLPEPGRTGEQPDGPPPRGWPGDPDADRDDLDAGGAFDD